MIVQCHKCNTRFRLDPSRLTGPKARLRCSRCGHVFTLTMPPTPPPPASKPALPEKRRPRILLVALLVVVLLGAAGYGVWRFYLSRRPGPQVPPASMGVEYLHLLETRGFFIDNHKDGQLFVVEGKIRNDFPQGRRLIKLRARLYTTSGNEQQRLEFYAGISLDNNQLRRLPLAELQALVRKPPPGGGRVQPGEVINFVAPFGNLPDLSTLSDYSVEIVASQPA